MINVHDNTSDVYLMVETFEDLRKYNIFVRIRKNYDAALIRGIVMEFELTRFQRHQSFQAFINQNTK